MTAVIHSLPPAFGLFFIMSRARGQIMTIIMTMRTVAPIFIHRSIVVVIPIQGLEKPSPGEWPGLVWSSLFEGFEV